MKETMMIAAGRLHPNPDNPRQGLGDLTELADSIKAKGILQHLVVMPQEDRPGEYTIIMGHRRHAAAVQAGLKELPCLVEGKVGRSDQVALMLAENLHRSNLTPYEEGQGFQMMLDLGETEDTISQKTGFGKTTVRHRINIAKLDQKKIKKLQDDPSFQLSLTDLVALEKVPDIDRRNEILGEARDGRDLAYRAQCAANEIKRERNLAKAIPMLEKAGVKPLPDKAAPEIYNPSRWQVVDTVDLEADLPESYQPKQAGELYHYKTYREVKILKRAEKKPKAGSKPETAAEKERREEEARQKKDRKQLLEAAKEADAIRREFILGVIDGKIPGIKGDELAKAREALWRVIYDNSACVSRTGCIAFRIGRDDACPVPGQEQEEAGKWADRLGMVEQMLIVAHGSCSCRGLVGSNGEYDAGAAGKVKKLYAALRLFGLRVEKETKLILDGRHGLYHGKPAPAEEPALDEDKAVDAKAKTEAGNKPAAESSGKDKAVAAVSVTKARHKAKTRDGKEPAAEALAAKTGASEALAAETPPAKETVAKAPATKTGPSKEPAAKAPMAGTEPVRTVAAKEPTAVTASGDRPKAGPAAPTGASPGAGAGKDGRQPASADKTQAA